MSTSTSKFDLALDPGDAPVASPAWKHELNERLAATRARRSRGTMEQAKLPILGDAPAKEETRAAQLAARVAKRYAKAPSYSELLAAEASAAALAAEAAVTAARQVCATAQALLAERDAPLGEPPRPPEEGCERAIPGEADEPEPGPRTAAERPAMDGDQGIQEPAQREPLPVNLIEFPRELIAARRMRPRIEEGPLKDSAGQAGQCQLRIFEVEAESISRSVKMEAAAAGWSPIRLDSLDAKSLPVPSDEHADAIADSPLQAAPLEDRCMAWVFDFTLVSFAFVVFVFVFAACTAHPPMGRPALAGGGCALAGLLLLYQYLFFRFTDGTPGMRYARIALCTFEDENPSRKDMRRRILYLLLSAAPLGLGFAWALFDADRLAWHDRLSRMYQRSYR